MADGLGAVGDPGGRGIVRLRAGRSDSTESLLARYAPQLIVLPEDLDEIRPPGPASGHDFHPRSARLFVDHARSIPRRGRILTAATIGLGALRGRAGRRDAPGDEGSAVRQRLEAAWPDRLAGDCLTAAGRVDAGSAWRRYRDLLRARSDRYPRTIYGRVVAAGDLLAAQFWLFWFHNAWHNDHEADWEVVTVLHDPSSDGPTCLNASAHGQAPRRSPGEVTWLDGQPVLYVATGSHALYAGPEPAGPDRSRAAGPHAAVAMPRTRLAAGSTRDHVAAIAPGRVTDLAAVSYELRRLPDKGALHPGTDTWDDWWWLAYGGTWGRPTGPTGPAEQGPAWDDPGGWVAAAAAGDSGGPGQPRP